MTTVSIIIPCYNRATYVGEAIESALAQSHRDTEVIVVDDGSTDDSWRVIESFGPRIETIRLENGGVCRARNAGLGKARGAFVKSLDSDDLLEPRAVERQLADLASLPEKAIPIGTATCIDGAGRPLARRKYNPPPPEGTLLPLSTLLSYCIQGSLPLFPAAALREVGGYRQRGRFSFSDDYDVILRLYRAGYRFHVFSDTPSSRIREHEGERMTTTRRPEAFDSLECMYREHLAAFDAAPDGPLGEAERVGFARLVWEMARHAARGGHFPQSRRLFALGSEIAGRRAWNGAPAIRALYAVLDPVTSERVAQRVKTLLGWTSRRPDGRF